MLTETVTQPDAIVVSNTADSTTCYAGNDGSIIVNATAKHDTIICYGDTVQIFGFGGNVYSWSPTTGLSDSTVFDPWAKPNQTTTYYFTAWDNICYDVDSVIIQVYPQVGVDAGTDQTILFEHSAILTATSTDLKLSFIFPKKNNKVYIGCTYQLSFQSSTTIRLVETTLIDAGAIETIEPIVSGLAEENKIEPNSQSLDWKVGVVWPGKYYIKVSNINGADLENYSKVFTISKMTKGISVDEKEKICKESDGSF